MNIVITGASKGIGFHTALLLSDQEHSVVAISRNKKNLQNLQELSKKRNSSTKLVTLACDISDEGVMSKITDEIKSQFKHLDVLINNAGVLINKPFSELQIKDWMNVFSTNVFGAVNVTKNLLPLMSEGSHIVNISSMGGFQGSVKFNGLSAYSSSKAALVNLSECLAEELKDRKIAVNCLCLGSVQTEMFSEAFPGMKAALTEEEMAKFIARFSTENQHFFNGMVIPVSNSTP